MIEKILNKIDEYECICLYRHVNPDYDAFGSQFGMYDLIQNTFENKEVYFAGDFSSASIQHKAGKKCAARGGNTG